MLHRLHVEQYRSLRDFEIGLERLTVLVGPNGCGKSNCYKALRLLRAAAEGRLARTFAEEGGLPAALWAGPPKRRREPRRVRLSVDMDHFRFELACGLPKAGGAYEDPDDPQEPSRGQTLFPDDPELKEERILAFVDRREVLMAARKAEAVRIRDEEGDLRHYGEFLHPGESMLSQLRDPHRFEELGLLRESFAHWRFYHAFETHDGAAVRRPQLRVRTPVIADDGRDLASALLTIKDMGERSMLNDVIANGLPGIAGWRVAGERLVHLEICQHIGEREVWFHAQQCSDGTLRFFCLVAALMSPRPPSLLVLNEPEVSLHEELLPALARLLTTAAERSQILLTTHSSRLAALLAGAGAHRIDLRLEGGGTVVD
jgi:predicted ATPase